MLMLLGLMVFLAQLGISAWLATEAADAARGDAAAALNVAQTADWLQGMRFAGVGIMLTGIALALFTITGVMTFMANRIRQIAAEAIEEDILASSTISPRPGGQWGKKGAASWTPPPFVCVGEGGVDGSPIP